MTEQRSDEPLHLQDGLDVWLTQTNIYWANVAAIENFSGTLPPLERATLQYIQQGMGRVLHQDPKDISALLPDLEPSGRQLLVPIEAELHYKNSPRSERMPEKFSHYKRTIITSHPLLAPFRDPLVRLVQRDSGQFEAAQLPRALAKHALVAGMSAVYQNIPLDFRKFTEQTGKEARRAAYLEVVDYELHQRGDPERVQKIGELIREGSRLLKERNIDQRLENDRLGEIYTELKGFYT